MPPEAPEPSINARSAQKGWGQKVVDPSKFPFSAICMVVAQYPDGYVGGGSGVLVSDHHVLTAAHNLYSGRHGGWATGVGVMPGFSKSKGRPFGQAYASQLTLSTNYAATEKSWDDYGMIALSTPIGQKTGWFQMGHVTPVVGSMAFNCGYPDFTNREQWLSQDQVVWADPSDAHVYVVTNGVSDFSASGSPLFKRVSGGYKAFGVMVGPGPKGLYYARINPFRSSC